MGNVYDQHKKHTARDKLQEILAEHDRWLRGIGGTHADLRDADLRDADLRGADLRDADLRGAVLTHAVLTHADLRDAVLTGADLTGADLRHAVLTGADLRGAVLRGADMRGADLTGGKFLSRSAVQFTGHGECGRELSAIKTDAQDNPITMWCGCFVGTPEELHKYIADGDEKYRRTRTLAMETVLMLLDVNNAALDAPAPKEQTT